MRDLRCQEAPRHDDSGNHATRTCENDIENLKIKVIMANNVTDKSFEEEVLKSDLPVLVDFWAEWCGPCKMLTPIIEQLSQELQGKVKILKMDIEENPETPSKYGIRSIPTLILFKEGKQADIKIGASEKKSILEWINKSI